MSPKSGRRNDPQEPSISLLSPIKKNPITASIVAVVVLWMIYSVVDETSPLDRENIANQAAAQDLPPPRPPTSVDTGEAHMLEKAQWVVQTLRSAKRAQMCGLRGQMWATRMEDIVFARESRDKEKFRTESADASEFNSYAKSLREWEMKHIQPHHPSDYECSEMARGPEIDLLIRVEAELKGDEQ